MTQVTCCKCETQYSLQLREAVGSRFPVIQCPNCELVHTVDFQVEEIAPGVALKTVRLLAYYYAHLCVDGSGYSGAIGSDANPPVKQAQDPTGWSTANKMWIGVCLSEVGCNKTVDNSATLSLRYREDGGSWQDIGTGNLALAGTGNMNYTDLSPPAADIWVAQGGTGDCCSNPEPGDHVAQDNSRDLATGTGTGSYYKEFWWAVDPASVAGGTLLEFGVYDSQSNIGTSGSPALLTCSVTIAVAPVNLVMTNGGAYHPIFTNVDNSPIDITEVIALVMTDGGAYHLTDSVPENIDLTEIVPPIDLVMTNGGAYHDWIDNDAEPLPATQVYPNDTYHVHDVTPDDLTLVEVNILVMSDAGVNYHSIFTNIDNSPLDLTELIDLVISDAGLSYHEVYSPELPPVQVYTDDTYHVLYDDGPLPPVQIYPDDCYHIHTAPNLPPVQIYPGDCYHLNVVDPTNLDVVEKIVLTMSDAGVNYHVIYDDGPLPATQVYPEDCYHLNVVDPTNLTVEHVVSAVDLIMTDGGAYHLLFTNVDNSPLDLTEVIDLIISDAGLNYHVIYDDGPLPATQVYPNDCYHEHFAGNILIDPAWANATDCYHLHVVDPTDLTLTVEGVHDIVFTDAGVNYHVVYSPELPATQVYVDDCYHLNVVTPTNLTLVEVNILAMSDAGVNYHEIYSPELPATQVYPEDCYHLNVVDPTNLTIVEVGAVVDLQNLDAYHVTYSPELPAVQVYPALAYSEVVSIPTNITLAEVIDLTIAPDPYHNLVTKDEVWFVQKAEHVHSVAPTNLTLEHTHFLVIDSCVHVLDDGVDIVLVQILNLVISDAGLAYHDHVVTPTDLNLAGIVSLTMTDGGAYHLDVVTPTDIDLTTSLNPADGIHLHVATTLTITQDNYLANLSTYHELVTPRFALAEIVEGAEDFLDAVKTLHDIGTKRNVIDLTTDRTLHRL